MNQNRRNNNYNNYNNYSNNYDYYYSYSDPPRHKDRQSYHESDVISLFKLFGSIPRWNGYALLFIMVCNVCHENRDIDEGHKTFITQFTEIQNFINSINEYGGASPQIFENVKEIFKKYENLRQNKNEKEMKQLIEKVGTELRTHSIPDHNEFIRKLRDMNFKQRFVLRDICVSRLRSFSEFASYIDMHRTKTPNKPLDEPKAENNDQVSTTQNISKTQNTLIEQGSTGCDESKQSSRQIEKPCNKATNKNDETMALIEENKKLRKEAARHQAALGNVINFRWRDDDPNNSMQLINDIEKLQRDLQNYTLIKKNAKQINQETVSELFNQYKCSTKYDDKAMKSVLAAVLQRRTLEFVCELSDEFKRKTQITNTSLNDDQLETGIISRITELCPLITRFSEVNPGNDEHTRVLPIKLRQQIYGALSNRGFPCEHSLIQQIHKRLILEMDKYRTIETTEKSQQLASKATLIIQQILNIFCFRLYTQEQIPDVKFYESGDPINTEVMDGNWQDDIKNLEVEICSFPAIFVNDYEKRIFTKAQVMARQKV